MPRLRILALSFFPAFFPPRDGGVERLFRVYSTLAERFDVTLISSGHVGGHISNVDHGPNFREIRVPKGPPFESAYQELEGFSGGGDLSGPAIGLSSRAHGVLHDEYLEHYAQADVIIHDSPFLVECDLFRGFDNKLRIYNSYNCETDLYRSFHSTRDPYSYIERLVEELERDLCEHADLITTCSAEDRQRFIDRFDPRSPIEIVPNGVMPGPARNCVDGASTNRLVFLGSNHKPNVEAANFIIKELAPRFPAFEFHVIGSCSPPARSANLIAHGRVNGATKRQLLGSALAALNPITTGGGSSLKVADIAMSEVPLISTELGVRGFDLVPNRHYAALGINQFKTSLEHELADPKRLAKRAKAARGHIAEHFSWLKIVQRFGDRIQSLAACKRDPSSYLVLDDYDPFSSIGGGATRTAGLCRGLSEHRPVITLTFEGEGARCRRVSECGRILSLFARKTAEHLVEEQQDNSLHWISTGDIVNYLHAPRNARLVELFRCAASVSTQVICEHPYMIGLPRMFGTDFVYSSQNFEFGLKAQGLRDHPRGPERIAAVREAEAFACGASSLIVAVSDEDARSFSGTYRITSPIMLIPNGADGPADNKRREPTGRSSAGRPIAVFMGSSHGPNVEAAGWILDTLAPGMQDVDFFILGNVANSFTAPIPSNARLVGQVSAVEKDDLLHSASVALNPMNSGSGSNVKVADYLQHGLAVVSTAFGARGYDRTIKEDVLVVGLDDFPSAIRKFLNSPAAEPQAGVERQSRYRDKLSMEAGGHEMHRLIEAHSGDRRRALYVTYRYNDPSLGGGEEHVVRLVHALASDGWQVDVAAPAAEQITDVYRFAAKFSAGQFQPGPTGVARVRSAKFDLDASYPKIETLRPYWNAQPAYEAEFFRSLPRRPNRPALTWGWGDFEGKGRWSFERSGIFNPAPANLAIAGDPIGRLWLQIISEEGELLYEHESDGPFALDVDVPAGLLELRSICEKGGEIDDPRPLAVFIRRITVDGADLLEDRPMEIWAVSNEPTQRFEAHSNARSASRDQQQLELTSVRNPSSGLTSYIRENVNKYDLLITHNAVFGNTVGAVREAAKSKVPSIFIPHLHYDDDFYHFSDISEACAAATRTLVCPSATREFLSRKGLSNLVYHAPGITTDERFEPDDARAFREIFQSEEDFFLVLGRKASAKGYLDVVGAIEQMTAGKESRVVLIGPDDDGVSIESSRAIYLGRQSSQVVRGALMECLALVNMSRSESFGMVLLEAGLAGKPVLANRNCAAFADIVEDGVNGFLIPPEQLPKQMALLISDPRLRNRLGKEGRKRALKHDWKMIERKFVQLCNNLADQGR